MYGCICATTQKNSSANNILKGKVNTLLMKTKENLARILWYKEHYIYLFEREQIMIKKVLCTVAALMLICTLGFAVSAASAYYEPYVLCYNSTHSGAHEGIQSGWQLDNRGGRLKSSIETNYNMFDDVSNFKASALIRDLNKTDEGVVTLETGFKITQGLDGFGLCFMDENKKDTYALWIVDGKLATLQSDGSYRNLCTVPDTYDSDYIRVIVKLDFETGKASTIINDVFYGTDTLLSDNIMRFAYRTTPEDIVTVLLYGYTKITANYYLHDDFTFHNKDEKYRPYGWTSTDSEKAYINKCEGYVTGNAQLKKKFDAVGGKLAFEGYFFTPGGTSSIAIKNGNTTAFDISFDGTKFTTLGKTVYDECLTSFWYRYRIEADLDSHTAIVKINGRKVADVNLPAGVSSVDNIVATASERLSFDDIKLFSLVEHSDYVPEPVLPSKDNYNVGINVCSLWAYTSNHGWSCTSPYDEVRPVLGYYDEGSPEVADWEIKMMTEHGIDFQAFCWYAEKSNAPIKNPRNSLQLHDGYMNAKYSDKMQYCIIWEAVNAGRPSTSAEFRNYFVPYWIENYFKDDRYLVIDNKPVFMIFGINSVIEFLGGADVVKTEFDYFREEIKKLGFDDLLIIVSNTKPNETLKAAGVDGSYAYNWSQSGYDPQVAKNGNTTWADAAAKNDMWMIPTLSTGFNSLPWHGKRYPNMTVSDYEDMLEWMKDTYFTKYPAKEKWQENLYMLSTWNEYGEGTYIMPAEKLNGFGYLEAVRKAMTNADNSTHKDIIPTQTQLDRIGKNYPQHVRLLRRLDNYSPDMQKTMYVGETIVFDGKVGFTAGNVTNAVYDGKVGGTSVDKFAYAETKDFLGIKMDDVKYLKVSINVSENGTAKLYYATRESGRVYTKNQLVTFPVTAGVKNYYVPIDAYGTLEAMRIMPAEKSGVTFTVESVEFLRQRKLFIDEKPIESSVFPEKSSGHIYFPFDPGKVEEFILGAHYEWDYNTKTLTLYDGYNNYAKFAVGSKRVDTSNGVYNMAQEVYLSDGLPMIDMTIVCDVFGMDYEFVGEDLYIKTENYDTHSEFFTKTNYEWNFVTGYDYGINVDEAEVSMEDGTMHITGLNNDIRVNMPEVEFSAEQYTKMEICMKYSSTRGSQGDWVNVFFSRSTDDGLDGINRVYMHRLNPLSSGNEYVNIVIDLTQNANWNGVINVLRVDPLQGKGSECYIKYIRLIEDKEYAANKTKLPADFTAASYNADDGVIPFVKDSAVTVTAVDDPYGNGTGDKAFKVAFKGNTTYVGVDFPIQYEPGATYTATFKAMLGKVDGLEVQPAGSVQVHGDIKYDDPAQYDKTSNKDDHLPSGSKALAINGTKWSEFSFTFTVNEQSFIRSVDAFRIYVNPYERGGVKYSVTLYIDDVTITKDTNTEPKITSTKMSGTTVTVSGTTGVKYPYAKNVFVAIYDADGRFIAYKIADVSGKPEFAVEFENAGNAATAKLFTWSGLRTFRPILNEISTEIIK